MILVRGKVIFEGLEKDSEQEMFSLLREGWELRKQNLSYTIHVLTHQMISVELNCSFILTNDTLVINTDRDMRITFSLKDARDNKPIVSVVDAAGKITWYYVYLDKIQKLA